MKRDDLGRLTVRTNVLGTEELHYDGATGRVAWTKLGNLRTNYGCTQDGNHRLGSIVNTWNGGYNHYTNHSYGYDAAGRLDTWTKNVMPNDTGSAWAMEYDASEQLESVEVSAWDAVPNFTQDLHFYQYDAAGNRTSEQRSGAVRSWAANGLNQVTQQTAGGVMALRGEVAPQSKVTVTPVNLTTGAPLDDPKAATAESGATRWKTKVNVATGTKRFSVRAEQTQVPQGATPQVTTKTLQVNVPAEQAVTFTYDADGNMLGNGIWTYKWDAENRLVSVKDPSSVLSAEVIFSYDAFHRRVRVVETEGAVTVSDKTLMWEGLAIAAQRESQTGELRVFHGNGETRTQTGAATVNLLYTRDHLGSIRELVDATTGNVRATYDYTPYGIRTKLGGDLDADFGYTSHYTNARTGLVLAPYRAYSPELGRWISRDPIEEAGGINLYGYVGGDPIGAVDPFGLIEVGADGRPNVYSGTIDDRGNFSGNVLIQTNAGREITVNLWSDDPRHEDRSTNCHGGTFLGGFGWLLPDDLGKVIKDDEWKERTGPIQAGDITVFYDKDGKPIHSATYCKDGNYSTKNGGEYWQSMTLEGLKKVYNSTVKTKNYFGGKNVIRDGGLRRK